jgi:hypothetical protein
VSSPASRSLEAVLRRALVPDPGLRVLIGEYAATPSPDPRYANVELDGVTLSIPNLNGAPAGTTGDPAYVLADAGRMWVLGTVTASAAPTPGAPTFIAKPGPPAASDGTDGAVYLDLTSLRFWGPKAAGAWPAAAFARVMPLDPTYAQIKSG